MQKTTTNPPKYKQIPVSPLYAKAFEKLMAAPKTAIEKQVGNQFDAKVSAVTKDFVCVDLGFKTESFIPKKEFNGFEMPKSGDTITVELLNKGNYDGSLSVSFERAQAELRWSYIVDNFNEGDLIRGTFTSEVKGGMMVDLDGVLGFVPLSHLLARSAKTPISAQELIGTSEELEILKIIPERRNLVVSRRNVHDRHLSETKKDMLEALAAKPGKIVYGQVKNITDFGAFVDIMTEDPDYPDVKEKMQVSCMDGLVHITDLSFTRITHPSDVLKVGEIIKVKILNIDTDKMRIALGIKQLRDNPWTGAALRYKEGSVVKGKVKTLPAYGAFIELEENIEGLVHASEFSWTESSVVPSELLQIDQVVEVVVLSVDENHQKMSLSLRACTPNPWERVTEWFSKDKDGHYPIVSAKVKKNSAAYGCYVELEREENGSFISTGLTALLHVKDISWTSSDVTIKKGEALKVRILEVNPEKRIISVSLKETTLNPWPAIKENYPAEKPVTWTVSKMTGAGIYGETAIDIPSIPDVKKISCFLQGPSRDDNVKVGAVLVSKVKEVDDGSRLAIILDHTSTSNTDEIRIPKGAASI